MRRRATPPFSLFAFQDIITSVCGIVVLITLLLALELATRILAPESGTNSVSAESWSEMKTELAELQEKINQTRVAMAENDLFQEELLTATPAELQEKIDAAHEEIQVRNTSLTDAETALVSAERHKKQNQKTFDEIERLQREQDKITEQTDELKASVQNVQEQSKKIITGKNIYYGRSNNINEFPWLVDFAAEKIVVYPLAPTQKKLEPKNFSGSNSALEFIGWTHTRPYQNEYFVMLVRPNGITLYKEVKLLLPSVWRTGIDFIGQSQKIEFIPEDQP